MKIRGYNHKENCTCTLCSGESIFKRGHKSGMFNKRHSQETKEKMRKKALKRNNQNFWKGKNLPETTKQKISNSKKGHLVSEETRQKISEKLKGRKLSIEHKQNIKNNNCKYWKGKKRELETLKKISATHQRIDVKEWQKFVNRDPYAQNWTNSFKRKIRKRDNKICLKCGKHQEKQKRTFSVHHINYNKQLTCKENCCTLCTGCNSEVNTNRSHWTKFFQSLLNEKYGYEYGENQEVILNVDLKKCH